jgi:hypothetical protein
MGRFRLDWDGFFAKQVMSILLLILPGFTGKILVSYYGFKRLAQ